MAFTSKPVVLTRGLLLAPCFASAYPRKFKAHGLLELGGLGPQPRGLGLRAAQRLVRRLAAAVGARTTKKRPWLEVI